MKKGSKGSVESSILMSLSHKAKYINVVCVECKIQFFGYPTALYCSEICKNRNRRRTRISPERKLQLKLAKYGLTIETFEAILKSQNGCCAICKSPVSGSKTKNRLSVDHDHITNKTRGLLCHSCNLCMGYAKDNPALLRKAAEYLEHANNSTEDSVVRASWSPD